MNQQEKEQKYKRDGFNDEYYKTLNTNFEKTEKKGTWIVENYNTLSRAFSERLSWLAGIGIGLLPLIFQYLKPISVLEKHIIIFTLLFLFASIVMGGIDFLLSLRFWDVKAAKNGKALNIWYQAMNKIIENYPKDGENVYDNAMSKYDELDINSNLKVPEIYIKLQVAFVSIAIFLQVIYLIIKIC
jgi:hypothetical protein